MKVLLLVVPTPSTTITIKNVSLGRIYGTSQLVLRRRPSKEIIMLCFVLFLTTTTNKKS